MKVFTRSFIIFTSNVTSKRVSFTGKSTFSQTLASLADAAEGDQWWDYQAGANFGWKISKSLGVFADTEYTKMWDSEMFITSFGLNYTFR